MVPIYIFEKGVFGMTKFLSPTSPLPFFACGIESTIKPAEYLLLDREDGTPPVPVLRHDTLVREAEARNVKVEKCILEHACWVNGRNFHFAHRAMGKDSKGNPVDEVGEASPENLPGVIGKQYPYIMSDKRAKDRLLIRLLGVAGKIYADVEFGELVACENEGGAPPVEVAAAKETSKTDGLSLEEAKKLPVKFGKFDGSLTLYEFMQKYPNDFNWLVEGYKPGKRKNESMQKLSKAAKLLRAAQNPTAQ